VRTSKIEKVGMGTNELANDPRSIPEDDDLVARLPRADQAAQAALCDRYGWLLNSFIAARLEGDRDLAEDVTVQVLMDACRNIHRFDARKAALRAWLYGIARRKILGEQRRNRALKSVPRSQQVSVEQMQEAVGDDDPSAKIIQRLEAKRIVDDLTKTLSDREMEVLTLHYVESFSLREIGHIIGRSEKAVDSLLQRAKQKARERLVRDEG
jgi:RNA polymerase sigma-70 factor, ECF subfamily